MLKLSDFSFLEKNLKHNQVPAKAVSCAISDYNGEAIFFVSSHSNLGSLLKNQGKGRRRVSGSGLYPG
jgi:hypothetical protein